MDGDDGVLAVVLAAEHLLGLAGVDLRGEIVEGAAEVIGDRLPGLGPLDENGEVFQPLAQRLAEVVVLFEPAAALQQFLRRSLVLPEVRRRNAFFDGLQLAGGMCGVKGSSAGRRRDAPDPDTCEAVRPTGMPNLELLWQ
jgi:hypothetical protein